MDTPTKDPASEKDEFFAGMKCEPQPCEDNEGIPIKELAKFSWQLKPLTVDECGEVSLWMKEHGTEYAFQMVLICGVVNSDGARVFGKEDAKKFNGIKNGPLDRAVSRIRRITGNDLDPKEDTTLLKETTS